jgi:hypothetical protein
MQTITIDVINENVMHLLQDLELLQLVNKTHNRKLKPFVLNSPN